MADGLSSGKSVAPGVRSKLGLHREHTGARACLSKVPTPTRVNRSPCGLRLNEHDKPLVYPADHEVKVVSATGHVAHEGKNYYVGEAFADGRTTHLGDSKE